MAKALSVDLRYRVVETVKAGSSCRAAAVRFGVSASSAIRWVARDRERGGLVPCKRGGNQRSHRIDAQRGLILAWIEETPDLALAEVRGDLTKRPAIGLCPASCAGFSSATA
jgi:transposase